MNIDDFMPNGDDARRNTDLLRDADKPGLRSVVPENNVQTHNMLHPDQDADVSGVDPKGKFNSLPYNAWRTQVNNAPEFRTSQRGDGQLTRAEVIAGKKLPASE